MNPIYTIPPYTVHDVGTIQSLSQIYPQNVKDYDIPKVWKKTKGKGIKILVLDSGCPLDHSDLAPNLDISACRSFVKGEDIFDRVCGHSTHCCGTIAAADNATGIVGMAPEATLITAKVLDKNGTCSSVELMAGLRYALELKPDILSMSLGTPSKMQGVESILQELVKNGTIIIASAGNNGKNAILYPAMHDECIAVGSYNDIILRKRSDFSSWGESLDIMAPGENIMSTFLNNGYAVMSGTSMAAPAVAGIIALLLSHYKIKYNRRLTVQEVKDLIFKNTIDIGDSGKDVYTGWGMINPDQLFATKVTVVQKPESKWDKAKSFFTKLFR